ncbi:hypothetical protein C8Q70DRAFT_425937 [Cubamyces menziesii]|nr:hypothetical protein C8Q70DRAFT_425937 [Cubamyces menziesii]
MCHRSERRRGAVPLILLQVFSTVLPKRTVYKSGAGQPRARTSGRFTEQATRSPTCLGPVWGSICKKTYSVDSGFRARRARMAHTSHAVPRRGKVEERGCLLCDGCYLSSTHVNGCIGDNRSR